jgi:lipoprotein-releasing system permease protein
MSTNQKIARVMLASRLRQLAIAVLSVVFGISMYVAMNGFMSGVNDSQTEITFTSLAHIKIYNETPDEVVPITSKTDSKNEFFVSNAKNINYTEGIKNVEELKSKLQNIPEITTYTPQINQNVFLQNGVLQVNASLSGVETTTENQLFRTAGYMVEGNFFDIDRRSDGIILGIGLAEKLGVKMDNSITVSTSAGVSKSFKILGTFETGAVATDRTRAIISIQTARQFFSKNRSYATEMQIGINDYNKAREVANSISPITKYKVEAWQEGNEQLNSSSFLRDILAIAVSLTILIVAGFGIYNIMSMTVNEKIREIAILKAMGFNGKDITVIFVSQAVFIGLIGGLLGLVLGNIIIRILDRVPFHIGTMTTLPVSYRPQDYIMAFVFGLSFTFIAGYLPARKASKIDPVIIIRG